MRRWLAVFLLVLLSLQITWSVAATYCQHETGATAHHFGHHEHKHQADDSAKAAKGQLSGIDSDCAVCHASCIAVLTSVANAQQVAGGVADHAWSPHFLTSPPSDLPERPNWSISA
ncbi:MAG: hypothetical protein IPJ12_14525 [Betaproteobacteria bacterium]|jgi:hypothetical protein|nr:hypothetical protein [Betaproteobacteria bacterium]